MADVSLVSLGCLEPPKLPQKRSDTIRYLYKLTRTIYTRNMVGYLNQENGKNSERRQVMSMKNRCVWF